MPLNARIKPVPPPHPKPNVHNFLDLKGRSFGRLSVDYYAGRVDGKPCWVCRCVCGQSAVVVTKQLLRGQSQSCGCLCVDRTKQANTRHGFRDTKVYRIWSGMLDRCRNKRSKDWERYGGRGIVVCEDWLAFENFLADMGEPPEGDYTIERRDNDGPYCVSNCIWALRAAQAKNRRGNVRLSYNGFSMVCAEWDRYLGFFPGTTARRIRRGWSVADAVTKPINKNLARFSKGDPKP